MKSIILIPTLFIGVLFLNAQNNSSTFCEWCLPECEPKFMVNLGDGTWCCNKKGNANDCSKRSNFIPQKNTNSDSIQTYMKEYEQKRIAIKNKLNQDVANKKQQIEEEFQNRLKSISNKKTELFNNSELPAEQKNKLIEELKLAENKAQFERDEQIKDVDQQVKNNTFYNKKTTKVSVKNGFYIEDLGNGEKYEGNYVENKKSGQGKYYFSDGSVYDGNWENDIMQGKGKLTWKNGRTFDGNFIDGSPSGRGKMIYKDGTVQEGEFKDGKFSAEVKQLDINQVYDVQ